MIAEARNVHAGHLTGLEDRHALGDFHWVPVDKHLDRIIGVGEVDSGPSDRSPRRRREIRGGVGLGLGRGGFRSLELRRGDNRSDLEESISRELRSSGSDDP